jgi:aldehyde dehydrogenase (NAD+)
VPAPKRGELVRLFGEELRAHMIDICDFAVGLSRQFYGLTIATERTDHPMMETFAVS